MERTGGVPSVKYRNYSALGSNLSGGRLEFLQLLLLKSGQYATFQFRSRFPFGTGLCAV